MKCYVYSHKEFDQLCAENGWNDSNIPDGIAFISICCTPECAKNYLEYRKGELDEHWFKQNHPSVFNIDFDDIINDEQECVRDDGVMYMARCITAEQAYGLYKFIIGNIGKDFIIHCRAGKSRSQAVCHFIKTIHPEYETRLDNPCLHPNVNVYSKLNRIYNGIPLENENENKTT